MGTLNGALFTMFWLRKENLIKLTKFARMLFVNFFLNCVISKKNILSD